MYRNRDPWGGLVQGPWYYGPDEPNSEVYECVPLYARPVVPSSLTPDPEHETALREALADYMAAFGQALEAHGIAYGPQQEAADKAARRALAQPPEEKP
jgi:hypothetical protein